MKNTTTAMKRIQKYISQGNLQQLIAFLDATIAHQSAEVLLKINRVLASPECLPVLIQQVVASESHFEKLLRESYYHENGFHKIVLLSGNFFKLRLHHFGVSARIPMENIHDHRWAFASTILSGDLRMDLFEKSDDIAPWEDQEDVFHFLYDSNKSEGAYDAKLLGKASLVKLESRVYGAGDSYLMNTHELHRIKNAPGQESITLILTGKPVSVNCNLFSRKGILEAEKKTIPYDADEMRRMLHDVVNNIEQLQFTTTCI